MNAALLGSLAVFALLLLAIWVVPVMGYNTQERYAPEQPIPFSHQHHVSGLGLDCRYCHTTVEVSQNAGVPSTGVCMTCHSQIWANAAMLAPDRQSLPQNIPLRWTRVYQLPDYVYFDPQHQHPHCQGRRLHWVPRTNRRHADDLEGDDAPHEL
jgi:hypothetical protein